MQRIRTIEVKPMRITGRDLKSIGGGVTNALSTVQKDNLVIEYEDVLQSESVSDADSG